MIPFVRLDDPCYGQALEVAPGIVRIVAHNPSKFTYHGTGTYVLGSGRDAVVIDPGPHLDSHREALAGALRGRRVVAVAVTHCHADHSPLATWLSAQTGAPTVGFGPHPRPTADELAALDEPDDLDPPDDPVDSPALEPKGDAVVEETTDHDFVPEVVARDGDEVAVLDDMALVAVHTPGHTSNHLCFAFGDHLFTGDHVMGWSTTVIAPPDGDMRAYFSSLQRVIDLQPGVLWPTHGAPVTDPAPFLDAFVAHRRAREAQVLAAVRQGETSIAAMVKVLYADVRRELHQAARRSVFAHLVALVADGLVTVDGDRPTLMATYRPAG